jgi:hypothetical protein
MHALKSTLQHHGARPLHLVERIAAAGRQLLHLSVIGKRNDDVRFLKYPAF